jgi:hypothetical protein
MVFLAIELPLSSADSQSSSSLSSIALSSALLCPLLVGGVAGFLNAGSSEPEEPLGANFLGAGASLGPGITHSIEAGGVVRLVGP